MGWGIMNVTFFPLHQFNLQYFEWKRIFKRFQVSILEGATVIILLKDDIHKTLDQE